MTTALEAAITPGGRVGDDSSLDRSPKKNWVEKAGGLPKYVRMVAHALIRKGKSVSSAIAIAVATMKKWARGGGNVSPKVQAAAAKAVAEWEAKRAVTASADFELTDEDMTMLEFIENYEPTDEDFALVASILAEEDLDTMTAVLEDGIYEEVVDDAPDLSTSLLAGGAPLNPPKDWFTNPGLVKTTPITLTSDGRIFGHIAAWDVNHIGLPNATRPPHSRHDYAFFKTGVIETDDGSNIPVGQITLAGGHAPLNADAGKAVQHYDDTASAFADVTVGEDSFGIWVSGGVRPGVSGEQIRAIRASAPSGDWRPINGNLELVAVCQVNVPGFPVARSMVAGGEMLSLVAAGASPIYALRQEAAVVASLEAMEDRMTKLEDDLARKGVVNNVTVVNEQPPVDPEEVHTTVVSSSGLSPLEQMKSRLAEAQRNDLSKRIARIRG